MFKIPTEFLFLQKFFIQKKIIHYGIQVKAQKYKEKKINKKKDIFLKALRYK